MDEDKLKEISVEKMMEFLQTKKVYHCTYPGCISYFDRPYKLAQHILAHNNIRPYACNQPNCTKAYTSKSHLDRHKSTVHMPQGKDVAVFSCPRCLKTFANRQNLKRHLNTVHKVEFSCDVCYMTFKKKNQLSTHMYQHTGIKAFNCDVCSEAFVSLFLKKRHMRYHKMYTCKECGVEFNHWSKYQKHLKADHHKDEFICNECGRSFKQRCHIVRHIKIHTEPHLSRTFTCPYENCERSYSRNSNLKQHILVKHMKILHECMVCHAKLSTKAKLNYHVQLHYSSGTTTPKISNTERKERKDEGTFKTSTALKLAGLARMPEDFATDVPDFSQIREELHSTLSGLTSVPEHLQSTLSDLTKVPEESHTASNSPPPLNLSVKTEYIEVEVDIPYDI